MSDLVPTPRVVPLPPMKLKEVMGDWAPYDRTTVVNPTADFFMDAQRASADAKITIPGGGFTLTTDIIVVGKREASALHHAHTRSGGGGRGNNATVEAVAKPAAQKNPNAKTTRAPGMGMVPGFGPKN